MLNRRLVQVVQFAVLSSAITVFGGCASGSKRKDLSDTDRARLHMEVGRGSLMEGDATLALQNLVQAEKLDNTIPEIHHLKSLAFYLKRDMDSATASARRAVKLAPDYSDAKNTLGKLLIDQGEAKEAEPLLLQAAKDSLYADSYKAHTNLGIIYYRSGKNAAAEKHFKEAYESAPGASCIASYYLGHLALAREAAQDALKHYDRASQKFCASFAEAHLAVGIAFERTRQFDRARRKFLEVNQAFPNTQIAEKAMERLKALP